MPLDCALAPGLQLDTLEPEAQLKAPGAKVAIRTRKLYATSSSLRPTARSSTLGMARKQHLGEICSKMNPKRLPYADNDSDENFEDNKENDYPF